MFMGSGASGRKTENSCHVGVHEDSSFYGNLWQMGKNTPLMFLVRVELKEMPPWMHATGM